MTVEVERDFATISLEVACSLPSCTEFAFPLYRQLASGAYSWPMSVVDLSDPPFEAYLARHTTARKRGFRAERRGYSFGRFDRVDYARDIHDINVSLPSRQGRPMSSSYLAPPVYTAEEWPCERHRVNCYGVFNRRGDLRAYTFIYRAGALALVSQILGHGDHLDDGIMFLLMTETVRAEMGQGGWLTYNRHDSGTSGLQWHKERLGFRPTKVEWQL